MNAVETSYVRVSADLSVRAWQEGHSVYVECSPEHSKPELKAVLADLAANGWEAVPEDEEGPEVLPSGVRIRFRNGRTPYGMKVIT